MDCLRKFSRLLLALQAIVIPMLAVLSAALLILAVRSLMKPSERLNSGLFKYASVYRLSSMMLIAVFGW